MTKKHYEAIAYIIKDTRECRRISDMAHYEVSKQLASFFEIDNPKFQREKFLHACGIECDGKHKSVQDIVTCKDCAQALDKM